MIEYFFQKLKKTMKYLEAVLFDLEIQFTIVLTLFFKFKTAVRKAPLFSVPRPFMRLQFVLLL